MGAAHNSRWALFKEPHALEENLIDLKDTYCPDGLCRSVIGNVYVYADTNHLTKAFEHTLAETIYERALAAGWKPEGHPGS